MGLKGRSTRPSQVEKSHVMKMPEKPEIIPEPNSMTRRQFMMRAGLTGVVLAGSTAAAVSLWQPRHFVPGFEKRTGYQLPGFAPEASKFLSDLSIAHGTEYEPVIKAAIDALGGMQRFIGKGDVVLLKPNVAFDRPPALAATTHPETFRIIAEMVLEAGAAEVHVADNPINSPAGCFLKSGIKRIAEDLHLHLQYPDANAFENLELDGEILQFWPFFQRPFKRATKVIGIAPCKDHNLCHASMTMKNWYGLLGGRRNQFHQHIHSIISDFALMMKPTLVVLDGMNVLMKNGPTGGRLSDVKVMNTIVAGIDMVAVDSYGYSNLLERDLTDLEYIHKAHARGLGNKHWKELRWKEITV